MAWNFIHFICLQGGGEESLPTSSLDTNQSEQSKLNPSSAVSCCETSLPEIYLASLFGMTSPLSEKTIRQQNDILTNSSKSGTDCVSAEDSPAKTYHKRTRTEKGLREKEAVCTLKCTESLAKYDRDTSSWKTHQTSWLEGLNKYSERFPSWGIIYHGELFPLETPARLTYEKDGGVWATPTRNMAKNSVTESQLKRNSPDLKMQVHLYPTLVKGHLGGGSGGIQKIFQNPNLTDVEKVRMAAGNGGDLNPDWTEWLMGFPVGWTETFPETPSPKTS